MTFRLEDTYRLPADLGAFDAAFAGLWFSHVPVESRTDFIRSLHARLEARAKVVFIPAERELRELLSPFASSVSFRALENFWLLEYEALTP